MMQKRLYAYIANLLLLVLVASDSHVVFATEVESNNVTPQRIDFGDAIVGQVSSTTDIDYLSVLREPAGVFARFFSSGKVTDSALVGSWSLDGAGSAGVGPTQGSMEWWSADAAVVEARACWFDDAFVFGDDGSFSNVMGTDTWLETWQGVDADACGVPVAPHDGSAAATYSYDESGGTITINGKGAHIGLAKATNEGELSADNPPVVPDSITYGLTATADGKYLTVSVEAGSGVWWTFNLVKNISGGTDPVDPVDPVTSELVVNGDFQNGTTSWTGADGAVTSYFAVAKTTSNNVYDVNLSQKMSLVPDATYTVSFKAKSSIARTMVAGLGLYEDPWTNVAVPVEMTAEWQTFTLTQTTSGFGNDNSRVLFDMGGDQGGQVWIDDVSVLTADSTELVTNGDFQAGETGWAGGAAVAANITAYFAKTETASGNVYDVNLSQKMTLVAETEYTVLFKAKSSIARTMVAGLGLYADPWTNVAESVSLTAEWETFTLTQTTAVDGVGFGDENSRVLFDMGGDQGGQVWIDDVSVTTKSGGSVDPEAGDVGTGDNNILNAGEVINFNSTTAGLYGLDDFGNNVSTLVTDPTDATNTVVSIVKGNETWAGTTITRGTVIYPLTATETIITARVWSPEAGITVRLKLEESGDNTHTVETDAVTTKAQEWETLTFDFSNPATNDGNPTNPLNTDYVFDTLSIFMNFGSAGSSETYYFDDVTFVGAGDADPSGSLDIDGNGQYDALTDGLLLLRGMFGLDGSALVTGTIASDAAFNESVDIESRIATLGDLADIDGDGEIDALTDGLLTLRYLFGLQGDTLINGVVASDATRTSAEEIEAHLKTLMPIL